MPIDSQIYGQQIQPRFNSPFENLSQILQVKNQMAGNAALNEQRRALAEQERERTAKLKSDADDQAALNDALSTATTPEEVIARLKTTRHGALIPSIQKQFAEAERLNGEVQQKKREAETAEREYFGHLAASVKPWEKDGPAALMNAANTAVQVAKQHGHDVSQWEAAIQQDPASLPKLLDSVIAFSQGPAKPLTEMERAQLPGIQADTAVKQQVAAGTKGGLTPEQQQMAGQAAASNRIAAGQLGVAQQREARETRMAVQAPDIAPDVRTTISGIKYLDLGDYQTPTERSKAAAAAKAAGIPAVPKEVGASLAAADTAKQNIAAMWSRIESKLPKDPTGRLVGAPSNKLSKFFQTDSDLAAFNSWRAGAIQAVQALVERGMGFRLNKSEIDLIMQNDMPQITDTVGTAKQRVDNMLTLLKNKENTALSHDRSGLGGGPAASPAATPSAYKVGDVVMVGGKRIKISAIHKDGTFDGAEVK
jgi:hypothetical protein